MASNDLFNVEDQTDEDFFDKLVEDDLGSPIPSSTAAQAVESVNRSDFDSVKAFASLSFDDESDDAEQIHGEKKIDESSPTTPLEEEYLPASKDEGNGDSLLVKAHSLFPSKVSASESDGVMELKEEGPVLEAEAPLRSDSVGASILDGSEGSGIKVLGWNEFYGDSSDNSGDGGLDVFSELGNNVPDLVGNMGDAGHLGDNIAMGITQATDTGLQNQLSHGEFHGSQATCNSIDQTATTQDASDSQYWENMYPGWKYDAATGQWYQVDYHNQITASQQSNSELATASLVTSNEVAYQRQSSQSVASVIAETSTSETISSWNLVSQASGSYPEHMVFDPQYPGWYYDTIAQEWRTLDSYNASIQSGERGYNDKTQNGYASGNAHLNDDGASTTVGGNAQDSKFFSEDANIHGQHVSWTNFNGVSNVQKTNSWQPEIAAKTETFTPSANAYGYDRNNQVDNFYGSNGFVNNLSSQQPGVYSYEKANQGHFGTNAMMNGTHNFSADMNLNQQYNLENVKQNGQSSQATEQFPYALSSGRSPDGRPPHAIVNFGFGGKLIVMKDNSSSFGSQASGGSLVSILNVMETVAGSDNSLGPGVGNCNYFRTLCHQSYPGPLTGGSVGSKDLNKWIEEKILDCETAGSDHRKRELLKLIISLLKIACQHYGKFRSPFGTDTTVRESETPESAVAKLFASLKKNGSEYNMCGALRHCLQHIPTEDQQRATASEVQNLLVSGRKTEALQCAQEGQLWGPALIIATQLGEQFYVDTVKQMALRQLVEGSPLRTLCLLIAGQPAEVFSSNNATESGGFTLMPHQNQNGSNNMLDEWEENLAVITANRTKDDELVITHLGDCLWKDRSEILAAHACYLIAEMNFEPYSDTARLCLIGADHWKFPRTYASPEAIQRTELYEYSKVLGNSQYILIPFQPYKIIYAHMLAEVGKLSDALKYCQAVQKSLKTGRTPEVDAWKQLISSLEERIRLHQQGGFTNLAPAKFVGILRNFFDSTAHRVVGGLPPPAPGASHENTQATSRVLASQSTMAMSSLVPSTSMEHISAWPGDGNKKTTHIRSVSEPDFFSRAPRQVDSPTKDSSIAQSKESSTAGAAGTSSAAGTAGTASAAGAAGTASAAGAASTAGTAGTSRFGRFGFLKKTVDLVRWSRGRQAKLGEENKFYYDENLKRWVEKGVDPVAEEPALPPPPTTAAFQNGTSDFGGSRSRTSEIAPTGTNLGPTASSPDSSSGMPPIPSSSNQFSSRGRVGVRARYVDTFNQGRSNGAASKYQPPAVQSVRPSPAGNPNFFIPTTPVHTEEQNGNAHHTEESNLVETPSSTEDNHNDMLTSGATQSFQTPPISSAMTMQRFPSMDNIRGSPATPNSAMSNLSGHSRRTASWGGNIDTMPNNPLGQSGLKPLGEVLGLSPSAYMPPVTTPDGNTTTLGEDLHNVDF